MTSAEREPLVAIVILNWNRYQDTRECIDSFNRITYANKKLFVVDNGSTDGSVQKLKNDFNGLTLVRSEKNIGFSGGNNLGIREALKFHPDYILIINNDTVVHENFLDHLVTHGRLYPKAGIISPLIYDYSDKSKVRFSKLYFSFCKGPVYLEHKGEDIHEKPFSAPLVSGCCMLIKAEVFAEIGLFDEKYFLYHEESDFCFRAKAAGFEFFLVPNAKIWHKEGASSKDASEAITYYLTRNLLYFVSKNYSGFLQKLCFYLFFIRTRAVMYLKWSLTGKMELVRYSMRGIKDYFSGKMGSISG